MKIYMETFGCTSNHGDASIIRGILEREHHKITESIKEADTLILLTCTVIATTEQRMLHRLREFIKENKPIIVSGCMASVQPEKIKKIAPKAKLLPPKFVHQVNDLIGGKKPIFTYQPKTSLPRYTRKIAIIPISEGCQFSCSYCITKKARGKLLSYPLTEIISDIRDIVKRGSKEIRITAQDTASYIDNKGNQLPVLVTNVAKLPGDFMVRIGMMNPVNTRKISESLFEAYNHRKIYKFLHLPVQSGSDNILKNMQRGYTIKMFQKIVTDFKKKFPDGTLATDIIVAFPGETNEQFAESYRLITKIRPDIVNITRFSARPNTKAKNMEERIETHTAKKRSKEISCLANKVSKEKNDEKIGKKYRVLVLEKRKQGFFGRAENYKAVYLPKGKIGEWLEVQIKEAAPTHLIGVPTKKK